MLQKDENEDGDMPVRIHLDSTSILAPSSGGLVLTYHRTRASAHQNQQTTDTVCTMRIYRPEVGKR